MIDLDANATTRPTPGVRAAMVAALEESWHNPSSVHRAGQGARAVVERARGAIAELIGARAREVVFTSGGTEAIDLAVRGCLEALPRDRRVLVTTRVEHSAVRELAEELERTGAARVVWAPVSGGGVVDVAGMEAAAAKVLADAGGGPRGVASVQWANNETGVVQPMGAVSGVCRRLGLVLHCDGTQWVGKEPTDVGSAGVDVLTFSPHKFHGPKGVGVAWVRAGVRVVPRLVGTQELGRRGGTEAVHDIAGAGEAAREAMAWLADGAGRARGREIRDAMEGEILRRVPWAVVNGAGVERLWNTSNIAFAGLEAEAILLLLSEGGVWASAGAACSSGSLEPSPVLLAMGVEERAAHGSIRLSLSRETTRAEAMAGAEAVVRAVERLGGSSAALGVGGGPRT